MKFNKENFINTNLSPNAFILLYTLLEDDKELHEHISTKCNINVEMLELQSTGYIKILEDNSYQLRKKALDLKETDIKEVEFKTFWDEYHKVTGLKKTDLQAANKYWNKLTKKERLLALNNIKPYYNSLPIYTTGKPVKKARTYLGDKNFNDEFEDRTKKKKSLNKMI